MLQNILYSSLFSVTSSRNLEFELFQRKKSIYHLRSILKKTKIFITPNKLLIWMLRDNIIFINI